MALDTLLIHYANSLLETLGEPAERERVGRFARPIEAWRSNDLLAYLDRLRAALGDDYLGLGAAPCASGASSFIIDLSSRCGTLRDAITESFRFSAMVTTALSFRLIEKDDKAIVEIRRAPGSPPTTDMLIDWHMIVWHKLPQRLIGSQIWLDRVEFDHKLDTRFSLYSSMFGPECVFNSDACRLHFARDLLDRRVVLRPQDARILRKVTSERFSRPAGLATNWQQTLIARLRADIAAGQRPSTIDELAVEFHVSGQTLRRRLKAEGIGYRDLKARARVEAARDALSHDHATMQEASFAAGFADPGGLGRALKLTQGLDSRQLREQVDAWVKGPGELH